jgi:hypothetical protein
MPVTASPGIATPGSDGSAPNDPSAFVSTAKGRDPTSVPGRDAEGRINRARAEGHRSAAAVVPIYPSAVPASPSATPYTPYTGDPAAAAAWRDASDAPCRPGGRKARGDPAVAPTEELCDALSACVPAGPPADCVAGGWRATPPHTPPACGAAAADTAVAPAGVASAALLVAPTEDEVLVLPGLVFTVEEGCGCEGAGGNCKG